jgi:hypothetical protein
MSTGVCLARKLLVQTLPQGPLVVFATVRGSPEGGHRTEYHASLDLRLSRKFSLGRGRIRISADLFNVTNAAFKTWGGKTGRGHGLANGYRSMHQPGRLFRLGFACQF